MSSTQQDVLSRLKALKVGTATPSALPVQRVSAPQTPITPASDVLTRLRGLKSGVSTPSAPVGMWSNEFVGPRQPMKPKYAAENTEANPFAFIRDTLAHGAESMGGSTDPLESAKGIIRTGFGMAFPPGLANDEVDIRQPEPPPWADVQHLYQKTVGNIVKGVRDKDPSALAEGIGSSAPIVAPFAKPVVKGMSDFGWSFYPPEPPAGGFGTPQPSVAPHVDFLTKSVGATNKIFIEDRFHRAANSAFPALKANEYKVLGRNVSNLRDVAKIAVATSKDAWAPYQSLLDATHTPIDRLSLLRQAVQNLPDELRNTQASAFKRIAGQFGKDLSKANYTANEIEQAAQSLNAQLKSEYKMNNLDRAAAQKLPKYAGREALLSAYRTLLDSTIKSDTGYDAAPLREAYGNIKAIHNAVIETPSGDDTLFEALTHRPLDVMKPHGMIERLANRVMSKTPDQLAAKAFKAFKPQETTEALVHAGWDTPTTPETSGPDIGYGNVVSPTPPPKQLYAQTSEAQLTPTVHPMPPVPPKQLGTGQKLLPSAGATSVKTPPLPPESFSEALAREQTPQSKAMREVVGKGPYTPQARPATAEEYIRTKGGREMKPFISSSGPVPTFKDTRVKNPARPSKAPKVPDEPVPVPKKPGAYTVQGGKIKKVEKGKRK